MNWKNLSLVEKIATVIAGLAAVVWVLYKVQPNLFPMDPSYMAIAVFTICEAVTCWREQRKWSYLLIAAAIISLACSLLQKRHTKVQKNFKKKEPYASKKHAALFMCIIADGFDFCNVLVTPNVLLCKWNIMSRGKRSSRAKNLGFFTLNFHID